MGKIVHVMISAFFIEGAGYQENLLPRAHKRMGFDVTIITSRFCFDHVNNVASRPSGTYINADGIKVIILDDNKRYPLISPLQTKCKGLLRVLKEEHPDYLFMHNIEYMDSYIVARYAAAMNIPLFCDNHADYYNSPSRGIIQFLQRVFIRIPLARFIAKRASVIWGTTPWRVQYLQQYYKIPKSKTGFLVMGADETLIRWEQRDKIRSEVRKKYGISDSDFLIITGGKINQEKNIHVLANAVYELNQKNVKLLIFGIPDEYVTKELDLISGNNIIRIGWVDSNDVYDLFLSSDLGFFPGTHSVLWEQAVACGLPSVFKYWEGMQHVNVNGNAFLLKDISIASIKKVIDFIVNDTNQYSFMLKNATKAKDGFMYCNIAKRAIGL